jgi:peptide/nickel transport system permease protein
MLGFILNRVLVAIPTLLILSLVVFSLQQLLPGDPALVLVGEDADPRVIAAVRQEYRLDQPFPIRYAEWMLHVLQGDFGMSLRIKEPVGPMLLEKIPVTLTLALFAMAISLMVGIPAGIVAATQRGKVADYVANVVALSGISIPNFWLGIMLILFFSVRLGWLPAGGYVSPVEDFWECLRHIVMPATVLGTALAAAMMRHTRSAMLNVMRQDYVRTARAKGLPERLVILKHALRNALVPIITLGTLQFGTLLAGAILTEQIFSIPGLGKMVVDAVFNREYAVVQAVTLLTGTFFILMSLVADVLYFIVNPKVRTRTL